MAHMEIDPELEDESEGDEPTASSLIPPIPISMDQSAGIMDLNKLLEDNKKCIGIRNTVRPTKTIL